MKFCEQCFICGEAKGVTLLDGDAPRQVCLEKEPCAKCKEYMEQGIILISVSEPQNKEEVGSLYRTGGWVVAKEEVIRRVVQPEALRDDILKSRIAFIPDEVWDVLGLPRGD